MFQNVFDNSYFRRCLLIPPHKTRRLKQMLVQMIAFFQPKKNFMVATKRYRMDKVLLCVQGFQLPIEAFLKVIYVFLIIHFSTYFVKMELYCYFNYRDCYKNLLCIHILSVIIIGYQVD